MSFFKIVQGNTEPSKVPLQLEQKKLAKQWASYNRLGKTLV